MAWPLTIDEKERLSERAVAAATYLQSDATSSDIENEPISPPPADASDVMQIYGPGLVSGSVLGGQFSTPTSAVGFAGCLRLIDPVPLQALWAPVHGAHTFISRTGTLSALASAPTAGRVVIGGEDITSIGITSYRSDHASESDRPFERLDEKRDEGARLRAILSRAWRLLSPKYRDQLAARVQLLASELQDEESGQVPSTESLVQLLAFLLSNPSLHYPDIVLTPDGYFRAEWHRSRDRHLAVTFLPSGEVRYIVFAKRPGVRLSWPLAQVDRLSGITSIDRLLSLLVPLGVHRWIEG